MNIAVCILAHSDLRLLSIYADEYPDIDFWVHIDKKSKSIKMAPDLIEKPNVKFLKKRVKTMWGGFSLVRASITLFENVVSCTRNYDYYFLISQSCLPLINAEELKFFCQEHSTVNFLDIYRTIDLEKARDDVDTETFKVHLNDWSVFNPKHNHKFLFGRIASKVLRKSLRAINTLLSPKFKLNLTIYKGTQWLGLSPGAIGVILDNPIQSRHFRYSFAPDEYYFHTILGNSLEKLKFDRFNGEKKVKHQLMYTDWSANEKPKLLDESDFLKIQNSNSIFCRKVDFDKSRNLIEKVYGKSLDKLKTKFVSVDIDKIIF